MLVLYVVPNHMDIQVQSLGTSGFRLLKIPSAIMDTQFILNYCSLSCNRSKTKNIGKLQKVYKLFVADVIQT